MAKKIITIEFESELDQDALNELLLKCAVQLEDEVNLISAKIILD